MTLEQMKLSFIGQEINSPSLKGVVTFSGMCFYLNGVNFNPSKAQIKTLYSESLTNEHAHFNEFTKGCFYDL